MIIFYMASATLFLLFLLICALYQLESNQGQSLRRKIHTFSYKDNKFIVDDFFILASFRAGSLNCELFEYLNANKNRRIFFGELDNHIFRGRIVTHCKMIDSFGFRGELKKVLFSLDSESITYHPDKINDRPTVKVN